MNAIAAYLTRHHAAASWPRTRRGNRPGFSLMELLIVITITIVLASLIFTFAGSAKKSAMKVRELNNIRNITNLVIQYQTDKNLLPGAVNRGIMLPSYVPNGSRANYLSTFLIDQGLLGEDDELWKSSVTAGAVQPKITYLVNSTSSSTPPYFFGRIQGVDLPPQPINALRANVKVELGGRQNLDLHQLWMIATADFENYGSSPLIPQPIPDGTVSIWGGRFYAFFDGHVDFIRRQTPSIYPSSHSGGYQ